MHYWIWHCVVLCIEQVQVARLSCVIEEIDCKIGWRVVLGHVEHTHTECGVRTLLRFRDWSRFELDQVAKTIYITYSPYDIYLYVIDIINKVQYLYARV